MLRAGSRGVLAVTALSPTALFAAGLGLAYVFGMVFPLLIAAIRWGRLHLDPGTIARLGARLMLGTWSGKLTDLEVGVIFLAMGATDLGVAYTRESTYTPDFLLACNTWASGTVATLALALGGIRYWSRL